MARSSIGLGFWPFKPERWVRFPHELLNRTWESLVFRVLGVHEIVGSNPAVLTGQSVCGNMRALGARVLGSTPSALTLFAFGPM